MALNPRILPGPERSRRRAVTIVVLVGLWSCAGSPAPVVPVRALSSTTALGGFMKSRVNPAFSQLSFLLFHDDGEPEVAPAALLASADELAFASDGLAGWPGLPGESEQSKLVFHEYADSLKIDTDHLVELLRGTQLDDARTLFESLHRKCDGCHHFFRADQSSVVGRRGVAGGRP